MLRQPELQKAAVLRSFPAFKSAGRKPEKMVLKLRMPMPGTKSRGEVHS